MPGRNSIVGFHSREQVLSEDLARAQKLQNRELLNIVRDDARSDDSRNPADGTYPGTGVASTGQVINGWRYKGTITGVGGTFTANVTVGELFADDPLISGDDSTYQVLRFKPTTLTFNAPDGANPRVDLVVLTPGEESVDLQARNVLLDPAARTVGSQNLAKTINPNATLTVVTGTPASNPVPPAVPAGSHAVWEVWVPAAAADAVAFSYIPRVWRRSVYPMSTYHGILKGCFLRWSDADEVAGSAEISFEAGELNKVVIDGEVISFMGGQTTVGSFPMVVQDTANNPFAVAAPATYDLPYYIYAVGGRHRPQRRSDITNTVFHPICLVESLTPPGMDGRPVVAIALPDGTTTIAGALWVACGWVIKNRAARKPLYMNGDGTVFGAKAGGFNQPQLAYAFPGQDVTFSGVPARVQSVVAQIAPVTGNTVPWRYDLFPINGASSAQVGQGWAVSSLDAGTIALSASSAEIPIPQSGPHVRLTASSGGAGNVRVTPLAWRVRIGRLSF